jgi:hypothetical protein
MKTLILLLIILNTLNVKSQVYPSFGTEINVNITGLSFDAMEPFISTDGNYLFFNNLNDGINTKLYYATKVNDSMFVFVGELNGTNQLTTPYLDAVADIDETNNMYWTSTRNYPTELNNLFHGTFNIGNVTDIGRVHGNFNKNTPGWLVMDHGISYDGQILYYNNARLDDVNCVGPCETELGVAQKVNDSTFNQLPNSSSILEQINDTNYIYYAPCISSDDLELYYTRYLKGTITVNTLFEICVAVRTVTTDNFSIPLVLFSETIGQLIEAPTLTANKDIMYYHKKENGSHRIVMRYRDASSGIKESSELITTFPNPTNGYLTIKTKINYKNIRFSIVTILGEEVYSVVNQTEFDISFLPVGTYFLNYEIDNETGIKKIIKTK